MSVKRKPDFLHLLGAKLSSTEVGDKQEMTSHVPYESYKAIPRFLYVWKNKKMNKYFIKQFLFRQIAERLFWEE